jgi:hypothetical protein
MASETERRQQEKLAFVAAMMAAWAASTVEQQRLAEGERRRQRMRNLRKLRQAVGRRST